MFSYRHAYHAGNHADVLKHMVLVAILDHMCQKDAALTVVDTHAGSGWYRMNSAESHTSAEALGGVHQLLSQLTATTLDKPMPPILSRYVEVLQSFAALFLSAASADAARSILTQGLKHYPGSPALLQQLLRPVDKIKLFELLGTDKRLLERNMTELRQLTMAAFAHASPETTAQGSRLGPLSPQVQAFCEDGFEGLKRFIPPPSRRGLVLIDPSYEIKTDYRKVEMAVADALKRFASGTYMIWYPIVPRPEAHALPRKLKTLANHAGKPWLQASISLKETDTPKGQTGRSAVSADLAQRISQSGGRPIVAAQHSKLSASGVFVINPPFTLQGQLNQGLPLLAKALGVDKPATFSVWSS